MKHQIETCYMLTLLKCAVNGIDAPLPCPDLNWSIIDNIAMHHKIAPLLYFALAKYPQDVKKSIPNLNFYEISYKKNLVTDTNRMFYWNLIQQDFEVNNIDYVLLKGSVSKYLYPDPAMRIMRDMDILYRNAENNTIINIFNKQGFETNKIEPKEISFYHKPLKLAMEIQTKLIDEGYDKWYEYLDDIWNRCVVKEGHEYVMTNEDFYIYHLIHMAKHFINGGIGINHVLDTYMIEKSYNDIDKHNFTKELEKIGLAKFYKNVCDLIEYWFVKDDAEELPSDLKLMSNYILSSGSFGVRVQQEANTAVTQNQGEISLLKRIFPNSHVMANYYGGAIKNHKWLLPFYWIKLNIERLGRDKKELIQSIKNINSVSDDQIESTQQLFKFCGF